MSTHVLQPLDLPNVYLQKVGCSKQEEHFTLALSDDAVDTPFLKKDQDQVFFPRVADIMALNKESPCSTLRPFTSFTY